MKNKRLVALIAGIVCLVILAAALFWSLTRSVGKKTDPVDQENNSQTGNQEAEQPEEVKENEPAEEEPSQQPSGNTEEISSADQLNSNPKTKAEIKAVLNDPFMILVNRDRKVSSDYVGSDLVTFSGDYMLNRTCAAALKKLIAAGKNAGYSYTLYSGYRSYSSQYNKYYNKIDSYENQGYSKEEATRLTDQYYAPPGASEHHTGLAADVCVPSIVNQYGCLHENYDQTAEFRWFSQHAHEYGFILRYPKGAEGLTGYNYEPWHYRYVEVEIATEIYNRGITFEEYQSDLDNKLSALDQN